MPTKANGDDIPGSITPPSNYPNPVDNNVNMHSMSWAYGVGNSVVDFTVPTAPSALSSTGHTATTAALTWTASSDTGSGVVAYDVYKGGVLAMSVTGTTASVTGLITATLYNFTVKARDAVGNVSAASNSVAVTTS